MPAYGSLKCKAGMHLCVCVHAHTYWPNVSGWREDRKKVVPNSPTIINLQRLLPGGD